MRYLVSLVCLLLSTTLFAQEIDRFEQFRRNATQKFESAREQQHNTFEQHRAEVNRRYADHIRKVWGSYNSSPSVPVPKRPEPVAPPIYTPPTPAPQPTPQPVATPAPAPKPAPKPVPQPAPQPAPKPTPVPVPKPVTTPAPKPTPSVPQGPKVTFDFYGTTASLRVPGTAVPSLFQPNEDAVANSWLEVSKGGFDKMLEDCLALKKSIGMGDWGYYCLVRDAATCYYGAKCNDNTVLQAYLLAHSGFRVRLARKDNSLFLLLNIAEMIYGHSYFMIGGVRYFFVESRVAPQSMQICNVEFPGEKSLSLEMAAPPRLTNKSGATVRFASKRYPELAVTLAPNKNLMNFYASYPTSPLSSYVHTSLSAQLKETLYPILKRATAQKPQREAVDMLLNFVQTAFEYKTDTNQFGYEKWFFGDEMFFYPFCDCDDRAIFFAVLVREVLGLPVVLLDYPNHIATAVRMAAADKDGCVLVDGAKYVVCDPTYINARSGNVMPNLDGSKLKIIKL